VPILAGEPVKTTTFSSKSGAKRIFQKCDIPIPVSAYDIYSVAEFENALARLIANNLDVTTWLFKMDDEFNGRGHASLNVETIRTVIELRKKKIQMTEGMIMRLKDVLTKVLPKKVKLVMPTLYAGWNDFISKFCAGGGVIEAAPPMC
jgi:IQ domain-containing protein H